MIVCNKCAVVLGMEEGEMERRMAIDGKGD